MKTLIIGLGKSGLSVYQLLDKEGEYVMGYDDNATLLSQRNREGVRTDVNPAIENFDRVVISPGVPKTHPLYQKALKLGKTVSGELDLALSRLRQPMIGITGTNGKTTVTLLIEHILKKSGKRAVAVGNVGFPLTSYLNTDPEEILVVELSSFQLETLNLPIFDIGIVLNITPDHLDRYPSLEDYAKSKCHLQACIKKTGQFWVHQSIERDFKDLLGEPYQVYGTDPTCDLWTDRTSIKDGEMIETFLPILYRNRGNHESENVLAAWIACKALGAGQENFLAALDSFTKPAHRIEFVATIKGIHYFNDSKGTNIDATIKAVEAMEGPVVLIAGGVDKGASYQPWKKVFERKVKKVIVLGQAAKKIANDLQPEFPVECALTLEEAVNMASNSAQRGDTILLSPGCSSYDMFRDYAHRGDCFKKIVESFI